MRRAASWSEQDYSWLWCVNTNYLLGFERQKLDLLISLVYLLQRLSCRWNHRVKPRLLVSSQTQIDPRADSKYPVVNLCVVASWINDVRIRTSALKLWETFSTVSYRSAPGSRKQEVHLFSQERLLVFVAFYLGKFWFIGSSGSYLASFHSCLLVVDQIHSSLSEPVTSVDVSQRSCGFIENQQD